MKRSDLISLLHGSAAALNLLDKSGASADATVGAAVAQVQDHLLETIGHLHKAASASGGETGLQPTKAPCPCVKQAAPAAEADVIRPLVVSDSVSYGYDNLGRLHTLTFMNGTVQTINYDAVGNRTTVVTTCSGCGC